MGLDNKESNNLFIRPQRPKFKKKRSRTVSEISTTVDSESENSAIPVNSKKKRKSVYNAEEESR
jgi:hypothetical protein